MPKEDVLYLVIVAALYILGQGYVDAKQQPVKEFPIEDFTQAITNIIQKELFKTNLEKVAPLDSIIDMVRTLVTQEIGKLNISLNILEPETVGSKEALKCSADLVERN